MLLFDAVFTFVLAGSYIAVGETLRRRPAPAEARMAVRLFSVFWYGVAAAAIGAGIMSLVANADVQDVSLYFSLQQLIVGAFALGVWGLVCYLFYLFTGNSRFFFPITILYAAYYLLQMYILTEGGLVGVDATSWRPVLIYATPVTNPVLVALAPIMISVPIAVGALAYLTLLRHVQDPSVRYRIVLVSATLLAWSIGILFISRPLVFDNAALQIGSRILGMASGATILLAYRTPKWIQRRYGLAPFAPRAHVSPILPQPGATGAAHGTGDPMAPSTSATGVTSSEPAEGERRGPWAPPESLL